MKTKEKLKTPPIENQLIERLAFLSKVECDEPAEAAAGEEEIHVHEEKVPIARKERRALETVLLSGTGKSAPHAFSQLLLSLNRVENWHTLMENKAADMQPGQETVRLKRGEFKELQDAAAEAYRGLRSAFDFIKRQKCLGKNPGIVEGLYIEETLPAFSPVRQ